MSDEYIGILNTVKKFINMVEHMHCAWHIVGSLIKKPRLLKCVSYYWTIARAITFK